MKLSLLTDDAKIDMVNPYLIAILEEIETELDSIKTRLDTLEATAK